MTDIPAPDDEDLTRLREDVFRAALEGRAVYVPAGAEAWPVATILIDGQVIADAVTVGHYVREPADAPRFGRSRLIPAYINRLPPHLAVLLPGAC